MAGEYLQISLVARTGHITILSTRANILCLHLDQILSQIGSGIGSAMFVPRLPSAVSATLAMRAPTSRLAGPVFVPLSLSKLNLESAPSCRVLLAVFENSF